MKSFVAVLLLLELVSANRVLHVDDVFEHGGPSEAVVEIIRSLKNDKSLVTLITASKDDQLVQKIAEKLNGGITIQTSEGLRTNGAFLVVMDGIPNDKIESFLMALNITPQEKVLIVYESSDSETSEPIIEQILQTMWRKFVLNVQVLTERGDEVRLYTFFPYTKDHCGKVQPVVWNIFKNNTFTMHKNHFPSKAQNFFNCELRVAVFNAPPYMVLSNDSETKIVGGVDGNILETLAAKLNFSLKFSVVSEDLRWGEIKESESITNRTVTGALGEVYNKSVDFSLGMFSKTVERDELVSFSMTYAQSPLVMVVPPGRELSSLVKLFGPFDVNVWLVMGSMMMFIVVITIFFKFLSSTVQNFVFGTNNRTPLLNIVKIVVGMQIYQLPRRNFARVILTLFVILWLVLRSLYISVLYKDLQENIRKLPVQTVEESLRLGFKYFMITPTQENIRYLPEVYNRRVIVSRLESIEILKKFDDPTIKSAFLGALDTVRYSNKVKLYGIYAYVCPQPLLMRQYGIVFPKSSFLVSSFDDLLIKLVENGLIDQWMSELTQIDSPPHVAVQPMKLTLHHLASAFQLLAFGVCIAFLAFLIEKLWKKIKKFFSDLQGDKNVDINAQ